MPFLDGRILAEEPDGIGLGFDFQFGLLGEEFGVGLGERGPAADRLAVVVVVFAPFGEEGGDRGGITLLECLGKRPGRGTDGLFIGRPSEWPPALVPPGRLPRPRPRPKVRRIAHRSQMAALVLMVISSRFVGDQEICLDKAACRNSFSKAGSAS